MADLTPAELAEIDAIRQTSPALMPPSTPDSDTTTDPSSIVQFLQRFAPPRGMIGGTLGGVAGAALGGAAGGIGAMPGSIAGAGLGAAGEENLRQLIAGQFKPMDVVTEGAKAGLVQTAGEAAFAPLRYLLNRRALARATRAATDALEKAKLERAGTIEQSAKTAADKTAVDEAVFTADRAAAKAGTQADKAAHATEVAKIEASNAAALGDWQRQGADVVTQAWKEGVPSWKDLPNGPEGLIEMVYGKGQQLLGTMFDKALKAVETAGAGRLLAIPKDAATALGIDTKSFVGSVSGKADLAVVDAGELAKRVVGFWKKDRDVYKIAVRALDQAGLGNAAAREEYMQGQSVIDFISRNKIMEGGTYHPDRVLSGLTTGLKSINALRNRGMGDAIRGPFAESIQGAPTPQPLPTAPTPRALPTKPSPTLPPPEPPQIGPPPQVPPGFTVKTLPKISPWVGGLAAEIPALLTGGVGGGGIGEMGARSMLPFAAGAVGAAALSGRQLVTRAARDPAVEALLHAFPTLAAQYAGAQYLGQAGQ